MILALDLGTKTGFAVGKQFDPKSVQSGTVNFAPGKFASYAKRFMDFHAWLDRIHTMDPIDEVVFEAVRRHIGTDAAHIYGGFLAKLTEWCEMNIIPYSGVPVGTIKKHFTGNGAAKKDLMIATAVKHGFDPGDDNEADALAILNWRLSQMKPKKHEGILG